MPRSGPRLPAVGLRLAPFTRSRVEDLATAQGVTLSDWIRDAIERELNRQEADA